MRTYEEGYKSGTELIRKVVAGEVKKKVIEDTANLTGGSPSPFRQGMVDACGDWLRKAKLLAQEIARGKNKKPPGEPRTHETAH